MSRLAAGGRAWRMPLAFSETPVAAGALAVFGGSTLLLNPSRLGGDQLFGPLLRDALAVAGWAAFALALVTLWRWPRLRFPALGLFIAVAVALPTVAFVLYRVQTGVPIHVQDGSYQTEIVAARMLSGHDPYGTDFTQTDMARWPMFNRPEFFAVLHHYPYPPLTVVLAVPVSAVAGLTGLPSDLRPLLLALGVVAFGQIVSLPWPWPARHTLLTLLFLNPFLFWQDGRNDVLWLMPLVAGVGLAIRERWVAFAWAFGIAAAFKVFAVPFLPLAALLLYRQWRDGRLDRRQLTAALGGLALPLAVTVTPFLLWDPGAFLRDTVGFTTESGPQGYPIRGYGLSVLLLSSHLIPSPTTAFPFGLLQAAVGILILPFALRTVHRRPSPASVLDGGTALTAAILFCALQMSDNYVSSLLFLFALALFARAQERGARPGGARSAVSVA